MQVESNGSPETWEKVSGAQKYNTLDRAARHRSPLGENAMLRTRSRLLLSSLSVAAAAGAFGATPAYAEDELEAGGCSGSGLYVCSYSWPCVEWNADNTCKRLGSMETIYTNKVP